MLLCIGLKLQILFPLLCIHFYTQIFVGDKNDIIFRHYFFLFYQYLHGQIATKCIYNEKIFLSIFSNFLLKKHNFRVLSTVQIKVLLRIFSFSYFEAVAEYLLNKFIYAKVPPVFFNTTKNYRNLKKSEFMIYEIASETYDIPET